MYLQGLRKRRNSFSTAPRKGASSSIHSTGSFRAILDGERARSDRSGQAFSVVAFHIENHSNDKEPSAQIARALRKRLRAIDQVGWLDGERIAAILPFCSPEGADKLANDLCQENTLTEFHLTFDVYTYPSKYLPKKVPDSRQWPMPSGELTKNISASSQRDSGRVQDDKRNIQRLEHILVRRLSAWRRLLDIFGALFSLMIFSPMFLAVGCAIKLTSKGPVIYMQERTGHDLRRFKMYKFRTMVDEAESLLSEVYHLNEMTGPLIKIKKDPRLTSIGPFLRRTSLDELPQFFNVLKGDMTIIGPRPLSPLPSRYEPWQIRRFSVRPGIACTWQAQHRPERDFRKWMRSDLAYIDSRSFLTDIQIFLKVFLRVIRQSGAS